MILCADDYGLSRAIDEGIIELIEEGKISSVSCMVSGKNIESSYLHLKKFINKVDIGIHLTLTEIKPLTHCPVHSGIAGREAEPLTFKDLLLNSYLGNVNSDVLVEEISAQIEKFISLFGKFPDSIDGHQHVQQLPVIRQAIVATLPQWDTGRFYIRTALLPMRWLLFKGLPFNSSVFLGNFFITYPGRSLTRLLEKQNIPHNRYLLGYYDYEKDIPFEKIFFSYMSINPGAKDVFFCHPGHKDINGYADDPIKKSRTDNFNFLKSSTYNKLLNMGSIVINRFPQ
jgi:chitin disaccharide deacetylase